MMDFEVLDVSDGPKWCVWAPAFGDEVMVLLGSERSRCSTSECSSGGVVGESERPSGEGSVTDGG